MAESTGAIVFDPAIQQRVAFDTEKMHEYAALYADGHDLGRLVVFQTDEGWLLADGFHRHQAAFMAGLTEVPCAVYQGSRRDALFYATSCNLHGKPLTNADKRKRVETLLADPEWAQWSDNSIARHCGVAQSFVSKIRHDVSLNSEISDDGIGVSLDSETSENGTVPTRRTYRNRYGQVRTMDTSRVGHLPPAPPSKVTVTEDGWTIYEPLPTEPLVLEPEDPETEEMTTPVTQPEVQDPAPRAASTPLQSLASLVYALRDAWKAGDWQQLDTLMDVLQDREDLQTVRYFPDDHDSLYFAIAAWYWMAMADASLAAIETVVDRKPRQRILYAGAELNRLYSGCSISMSNHAV